VAADLFKETFSQFSESKEARNRYNGPVHNSAAVLSAEQFRRVLAEKTHPERDTVVFLTGIPGAGKTSSVLAGGEMPSHYRMIFEGQLSNPETTKEKIQQVFDAGLKPVIIAVHAKPENALDNTIKRFNEEGRGASINVMSSIQGGLPASLGEVQKQYGDAVELKVYDYRDRANPSKLVGWNHLDILQSEGNHAQIKERLSNALERHRTVGTISDAAYRQASGAAPLERNGSMGKEDHAKYEKNVHGRSIPSGDSEKAIVEPHDKGGLADTAAAVAKNLAKHLAELQTKPAFENHSNDDLSKIAYYRALLADKGKFAPVEQQEAALTKFDSMMQDPKNHQALPDVANKIEEQGKNRIGQERESSRDDGISL